MRKSNSNWMTWRSWARTSVEAIGALDNGSKDFFEEPVIDAAEIGAVGSFEDCVGDIRSHFGGDGFGGALLCPHYWLVD